MSISGRGLYTLFFAAMVALNLSLGVEVYAQSSATDRLNAPPAFSRDTALTRARTGLRQRGYVNQDHIDLDAYYAVDKRYDSILLDIDRMVSRGDVTGAFYALGNVMSYMYPHNRKAWLDASKQRQRLAQRIPGLARSEYETVVIEHFMVTAEVCAIEADGYKAPQLQQRHPNKLRAAENCLRDICQRLTSVGVTCPDSPAKIATGTDWNKRYSFVPKGSASTGGGAAAGGASPALGDPAAPSGNPDAYASTGSDNIAVYVQPSVHEQLVGTLNYGIRVSVWEYAENADGNWIYICGHRREWCGWALQGEFFRE